MLGSSHWPVDGQHYLTLEATAYALLALVKAKVSTVLYSMSTATVQITRSRYCFSFINMVSLLFVSHPHV